MTRWIAGLLVVGLWGADAPFALGQPAELRTQLLLLGTGTPNAEPDRSGPAVAVVVEGYPYLVDMGPGIVRQVNAAKQMEWIAWM